MTTRETLLEPALRANAGLRVQADQFFAKRGDQSFLVDDRSAGDIN
jgi:hypothetical protein